MTVRCPAASDRHLIHEALTRCGAFTDEEIRVAIEMFDSGLAGDYSLLVIETGGALRAYACFGKAEPDRSEAGTCTGSASIPSCKEPASGKRWNGASRIAVRQMGGERLVLETSGRPDYERSRRFYERAGFTVHGRIPDFYKPGDDCIIYCKMLGAAA